MTQKSFKQKEIINNGHSSLVKKSGFIGRILLLFVLLATTCTELFAQDFEISLNPRRLGNQLGVEVWVKTLNPNAPNIGDMSIPVSYNGGFLTGANPSDGNQPSSRTDAIANNLDTAAPHPYYVIESEFANRNGFRDMTASVTEDANNSLATLEVRLTTQGTGGFLPSDEGRGTFVGMLRFNIKNVNLTDASLSGFAFNSGNGLGVLRVMAAVSGADITNTFERINPEPFTVRGITILNPNVTGQTINRYPAVPYTSMGTNYGYPIYFERSGLLYPNRTIGVYGTQRYAYQISYSTDNGNTWTETGRVAESRLGAAQLTTPALQAANFDGMVDYQNATINYYTTTGRGHVFPADVANNFNLIDQPDGPGIDSMGYGGVLKIIWKGDPNFPERSENARLQITQLTDVNANSNTALRDRAPYNDATRRGVSSVSFVLGRIFFVQLDGDCKYLRTQTTFNTPHAFTVEAWINLNGTTANTQPGIVASSSGYQGNDAVGGWMLYLDIDENGVAYPAFRVRAAEGGGLLANIRSAQPISMYGGLDNNGNVLINAAHSRNWTHIAAVVNQSIVRLYIDGEQVAQYIDQAGRRNLNTDQRVWAGINPDLADPQFLFAGIKEVKVWRTPLSQARLRQYISGVPFPTLAENLGPLGTVVHDVKPSLELYMNLQGTLTDIASHSMQRFTNSFNYFVACNPAGAVANNIATQYRPDGSHIKLTSPSCGEGVSNLKGRTYEVRWASYGIGSSLPKAGPGQGDIMIQISRDNGANWFDAIGQDKFDITTGGTFAVSLDDEEVEAGSAIWEPYNNVTLTSIANDIQGVFDIRNNYSKTVRLRISGTDANGQQSIFAESGDFIVAPNFALQNNSNTRVTIPESQKLNISTPNFFMEAWIRPYSFPDAESQIPYYPIIVKKSEGTAANNYADAGFHYGLRLLPTGQLSFVIQPTDENGVPNGPLREARSDAGTGLALVPANGNIYDLDVYPWYHVGVYVDFPRNGTESKVVFLIDGIPQETQAQYRQLGRGITLDIRNTYPTYLGWEPFGETEYGFFDGEMKEFRFWGGMPAGIRWDEQESNSGVNREEYTFRKLWSFIQGASTVRANELIQVGSINYAQNLIAAYSMNGGSWVNDGADGTIAVFPSDITQNAQIFGNCSNGGRQYIGTSPYIKLVEPFYQQMVANTDIVRVRWVGFDYNRNDLASFTGGTTRQVSDLGVSALGGGQPAPTNRYYPAAASIFNNTAFTNALVLPRQVSLYEFQGAASRSQFAAMLNMGIANPDLNNNLSYDMQGPVASSQQSGRLELVARANVNSPDPLEFANYMTKADGTPDTTLIPTLRNEGPTFSITPPSNFTVRVLLEGYHQRGNILGNLGNTFENNALRMRLYRDNGTEPGDFVPNTIRPNQSSWLTTAKNPANRQAGENNFANVPFTLTEALDGKYFVVIDHQNYLPLMSAYAAGFQFEGDNAATWGIESGWDFQGWNGVTGNYMSQSQADVPVGTPMNFGSTHTAWAEGGNVTADRIGVNHQQWPTTPLNFTGGGADVAISNNTTNTFFAAMSAGDVIRDGHINSADRSAIGRNASMTNNPQFNLKGYGVPNSIDRTIVDLNAGKVSHLKENFPSIWTELGYPADEITTDPDGEFSLVGGNISNLSPSEIEYLRETRLHNFWSSKSGGEEFQSGTDYKVSARINTTNILNGFIDVEFAIQNLGSTTWAMANASYPIIYDPAVLMFDTLLSNGVLYSSTSDVVNSLGYLPSYSAPSDRAIDPVSNVASIEINFDANIENNRKGQIVADHITSLGVLRFKVLRNDASIFLRWAPYAAVLTVDGFDITRDGTFEDIQPIIVDPVIEITSPNGGEQFEGGRPEMISWKSPNVNTMVNLEYSSNGGNNWTLITYSPIRVMDREFIWITPFIQSNQCLVRIVNAQNGNEISRSKNIFSINTMKPEIIRPSSDDQMLTAGSKDFIEWIAQEPVNVYFEYSENGVSGWTRVTEAVSATLLKVEWTVRNSNTCNAVIRMVNNSTGAIMAISTPFRVGAGSLALTAPTKGQNFNPGTKTLIRWNSTGVSRFNLEYTVNAGLEWLTIANDVQASTRQYNWTVPNVNSTNVMVRAVNSNNSCLVFSHTEMFSIGTTNVEEEELPTVTGFGIASITPNPVTNDAKVRINLATDATVSISIYDILGNKVMDITSTEMLSAGSHSIGFSAAELTSGVYVVRMQAGTAVFNKEFVKVK